MADMNRRGFLKGFGLIVGGLALEGHTTTEFRTKQPLIEEAEEFATVYYDKVALDRLRYSFKFMAINRPIPLPAKLTRRYQ